MTITPEMKHAFEQGEGQPLRLSDPESNESYYLVKEDVFDRIRTVLEDVPDMTQVGILVDNAMREDDAGDPLLDTYQKYRS